MAASFCAGKRFLHILLGQYIMRLNGKLGQDVLKNIIHDIKISSKFKNIRKGAGWWGKGKGQNCDLTIPVRGYV